MPFLSLLKIISKVGFFKVGQSHKDNEDNEAGNHKYIAATNY